ncbi:MAG TPA: hypothetical protein VKV24_01825 [Casimicrobiaceae bacterium]|nr:hypothetical protein [Casimicrobiaceae bacterium]
MREIQIDRNKPLSDQPHLGHNRFHPKIEPVLEVDQNGISEYRAATCWLDWNHSGVGFLRDIFNERFVVHWNIKGGSATSQQLPGIRIPGHAVYGQLTGFSVASETAVKLLGSSVTIV